MAEPDNSPITRSIPYSSRREELPETFRLYALEGMAADADDSLTKQAVTLARQDERLRAHDIALATHTEQIGNLTKAVASLGESMSKVVVALYGTALAVTGSAVGFAIMQLVTQRPR